MVSNMPNSTPPSQALPRRSSVAVETDELARVESYDGVSHGGNVKLERRLTNEANAHPGDVRINVKGAFIVDTLDESQQPQVPDGSAQISSSQFDTRTIPSLKKQSSTPGERFDEDGYLHETKDIRLPHHKSVISHIAVDIGGSLAKLVYFSHEEDANGVSIGGRLNFLKFETDKIDTCIQFMQRLKAEHIERTSNNRNHNRSRKTPDLCVMATGGGAYKYYDRIREALGGVEVLREDEMECLIIGLDFFISEIPNEVFTYSESNPMEFSTPNTEHIYPYLLVNIGSGVSMIKVTGPREFQRVGGTSLGGGTLWGLLSLLTGARNFEEMLDMAERGDNTAIDMLVGDIYGTDYNKIGLKSTTIASTFGKVYRTKRRAERDAEDHGGLANGDAAHSPHPELPDPLLSPTSPGDETSPSTNPSFNPLDISRSLLYAISNNIGQIAFLHAERHGCKSIYFGGSFIGGHWQTMATLSYAIRFWSTTAVGAQAPKRAYFLRHEGYLGAVGAFLKRQPRGWGRRGSLDFTNVAERPVEGRTLGHSGIRS